MKEYIMGLHHVGIPTNKMDETIKFYSQFGAKIIFEKEDSFEGKPIRVVLIDFAGTVLEFYERDQIAGKAGALEHIAFSAVNIEKLYALAKENGCSFMEDCANEVQSSSYWPKPVKWFIVYGVNGEKIEFSEEK